MIALTKMSGDRFLINLNQIETIETIPECKIMMMNHDYYIVRETADEILQKIQAYYAKIQDIHREVCIKDRQN